MEFNYNIHGQKCNRRDLLLHINEAKNCCVSPDQGICRNFTEQQLAQYCCFKCNNGGVYGMPKGTYVGRKLFFEYTPESDRNWQNTRCENIKSCPCSTKKDFIPENSCSCPKFSGYSVM